MLTYIIMIGFSLYLVAYGFIALFKQEWLMKLRAFSARVEGKGNLKHDELSDSLGMARRIMAIAALVLGLVGLVMSIMTFIIYLQAQSGSIAV